MKFSTQNITNYYLYDTSIENLFISEYMTGAPGDYVKAYLLALMCAELSLPMDNETMGKKLGLETDEIIRAWNYWEKLGLVQKHYENPEDRLHFDIEFLNIREETFGRRTKVSGASTTVRSLDDKALGQLYRDIEATTRRLLESNEPEAVASWISDYDMSPDFILLGYKYCTEKRRSNRCNYVGTVLKDWRSKSLTTVSQVLEQLESMDAHYELYKRVLKSLGLMRNPTDEEKRIMNTWFDDMGLSMDRVLEACKKTSGISNPNINYINTVLVAWKKEEGGVPRDDKTLFARIEAMYQQDREQNRIKTEENRAKIFTELPRIKGIMEELREASISISKAMLLGENGKPAIARAQKQVKQLNDEKQQLLAGIGLGPDAVDTIYTCKKCRDTGVLDDGQRCSCYGQKAEQLSKQTTVAEA